jgi:probable HAF family extracellular repeat protein
MKPLLGYTIAIILGLMVSTSQASAEYRRISIGTLGGTVSRALSINNLNQTVGYSTTSDGVTVATQWDQGWASAVGGIGVTGDTTVANAINNSGLIVGYYSHFSNHSGVSNGTSWSSSGTTDLDPVVTNGSLAREGSATAVNDAGQIVGYSGTGPYSLNTVAHATLWSGTTATDLGTLGGATSHATSINNSGQIVGYSDTSSWSVTHATYWNNGTITDLGTLGGSYSIAHAINNAGLIVGASTTTGSTNTHATLWNGAAMTDLGTLTGSTGTSEAEALNESGLIVGYSLTFEGASHATLWENGNIIDLNTLLSASDVAAGWVLVCAYDINDNGWIVGSATLNGVQQAFILASVPEPASYAMLLASLALFGLMGRRRTRHSHGPASK